MTKLEDVLKDFDRRLSSIEKQLSKIHQSDPPITNINKNVSIASRDQQKTESKSNISKPINTSFQHKKPVNDSSIDSSSVLAIIGIIFVILAGVFFIKITIDSGWLTPIRQILLATGTGLVFFIIPQFFPKAEKEYGALLAGAGTTILHLTWLGAYFYHHILNANSALICATLVGIFSIFANFNKGNRAYILVAMAGTYLSAPIIGYNTGELSVLSVFLIIWNISFSATSLVNKRRDIMLIASYYAVFTVLLLSEKASGYNQQSDLLILQLIQFVIFSSAMTTYSVYHKSPFSSDESVALLPLLLLFYFSTGHLISSINPSFAPWFGITIGGLVLGIYLFAKSYLKSDIKSGPPLTAFSAITFVHSFYFQLLSESVKPLAALIIGVIIMAIWSQSEKARKQFFWPLMVLFSTFVYGAILTIILTKSIGEIYLYNWAYGVFALVAVVKLASNKNIESDTIKYSPLLLGFGHLQVMLGLYRFSQQISWSGALFVTITWGVYAAIILSISYWRRDKTLGNSALTILLAVSLKAFFYDLTNTSNLIRVGCLLAEGLLLYCCGWIFKKMQQWDEN